ncbi:MAG TPA: hypothetical protein VFA74_19235 [Terriglobales bacterium]|nr:hypothetical protein [Terriglobales bacterium]
MTGTNLIRIEEATMEERKRAGSLLMTLGKVLLWTDFLLLMFVYVGIRSGSHMWLWWVIIEGVLGLILLEIGSYKRGSLTE